MKKLFYYADKYAGRSTWKDFALIKFCLCSIGVCLGIIIPSDKKKSVFALALAVFVATYIPLMSGFIKVCRSEQDN